MKKLLLACLIIFSINIVHAQKKENTEHLIRHLEQEIVSAILNGDTVALKTLWSSDYLVNTPRNDIAKDRNAVLNNQRAGLIDYSSFERIIEEVRVQKKVVITMGYETLVFKNNPGKINKRRFTNVWMKKNGRWQQTARHASVMCE